MKSRTNNDVDGDYLDLIGPDSDSEIERLIEQALRVTPAVWDVTGPFAWGRIDASLVVIVDYGCEGDGTARIAITDLDGGARRQRATADLLRRHISSRTDWALTYTTDCR